MTSNHSYRPTALLLPAVGLVAQEIWAFQGIYLGDSTAERVQTAVGFALWMAAPHVVVAVQMRIATRRSRTAWWVSLAAGVAVILTGIQAALVLAASADSTDPLAGLPLVVTPLAQLGIAVPLGLVVLVLTLVKRRARPVPGAGRPGHLVDRPA